MKSRNRKSSLRILKMLFAIIFFASFSIFAQDDSSKSENSKVSEMTGKLNKKLILSDEQISEVQSILQEYFDGIQNTEGNSKEAVKLRITADEKIQDLFDKKQKMKFSIISDDWWALAKE
jgi:exopolysaccharide biosynthesis protein